MDLEQRYDTKEVQIETKEAKKTLEEIEVGAIQENLTTMRLKCKLECCKHDLNAIKMKIKRWERLKRILNIKSKKIKSDEDRIHKKMTLFLHHLRTEKVK